MPFLTNPSLLTPTGGGGPGGYAGAVLGQPTLLGYWRQGETSGTVMSDSGPSALHGIYRQDKVGATGLITGDTDGATFSNAGDVTFGSWMNNAALTVECVIQSAASPAGNKGIFTRFGSSGSCFILWVNTSGELAWRAYNTSGSQVDLAGPSVAASTKYHLAATYQSGQARLYVNGTQVASSTALTGTPATAGQDVETMAYNGGSFNFDGVGDEFALYSSELSAGDIAAHAALV